ncbi:MAG: dephospho-CoA kinase [Bdellovibrionales bacterium]|nr:dephospho-CoA kinase [Bdellovibrionales bacterium]
MSARQSPARAADRPWPAETRVWGLTGGIASGKSSAARVFERHGIVVIDADRLIRELSMPGGRAHEAIVKRFGTADRAALRKIVFADASARRDLEAILHPLVREESLTRVHEALARARAEAAARGEAFRPPVDILYEAALLVETGRYRDFDGLIVLQAPRELRAQRLMSRDGIAREQADAMIRAQASDEERQSAATAILPNSGDPAALEREVDALVSRIFPR